MDRIGLCFTWVVSILKTKQKLNIELRYLQLLPNRKPVTFLNFLTGTYQSIYSRKVVFKPAATKTILNEMNREVLSG